MILSPDQKLRISSKPENIILVERMIDDVCEIFSVGEEKYGNILISVTEAVNNAILHGNKSNPAKSIDISFKSSTEDLTFVVKDEGDGFNEMQIADPTAPENLEKETGRGVFLMKKLSDKIAFEENGRKVSLSFWLN